MQRVYLQPYDSRWPDEFARESLAVASALGSILTAIHHIGSTAIPGIRAKPIIDMLAVSADISFLDESPFPLEALGYEALGEFGIAGRRYFRKNNSAAERTHQIHAFQTGSPQIFRHLAFCDYLRAHPDAARDYDALKQKLAESYPNDISSYTDGKDSFIHDIDRRAASWLSACANKTAFTNVSA
jgi:GrpB-like predicted nucleotidyltransferase (UPF0157 family)